MARLGRIVEELADSLAIQDKIQIHKAFSPALTVTADGVPLGDDCAAIPEADGTYLLVAAEGLLDSFVRDDPWFAGYCAVMVNVSDICAMGGRPTAIVDVMWAPDHERTVAVWEGMRRAARDYGVPIVGGHTTLTRQDSSVHLAASIVGRAKRLMTSFDAKSGDALLLAVDLDGSYRRDKPFWNCSVGADPKRLRSLIALLPEIAEKGWCRTAKDVSNGGIVGTLIMLLECSEVGARLDLSSVPAERLRMLTWYPILISFGINADPIRPVPPVINTFDPMNFKIV